MNHIIINADDFGRDASTNRAIAESFAAGNISDTSLMVTVQEGLLDANSEKYKRLFKGMVGIHLCLTLGRPLTNGMRNNKKYCEKNGFFRTDSFKKRFGIISKRDMKNIFDEFCAQIEMATSCGWRITHVDTHQHIHMYPSVLRVVFLVCNKYKISPIRPFDVSSSINLLKKIVLKHNNRLIHKHCHDAVDCFCDIKKYSQTKNTCDDQLVTEIMVHPVYNSAGQIVDKTNMPIEKCDSITILKKQLKEIELTNFSEKAQILCHNDDTI